MSRRLAGVLVGALAIASCGSRTGLFAYEVEGAATADAGLRDAAPEGAVPCLPGRFAFELAIAQLMFVVDRSGSMGLGFDGRPATREEARWTRLREALAATLPAFDQEMAIGAKFFPETFSPVYASFPDIACATDQGIGIAPARGNVARILDTFDTTTPRGGTPTSEALRSAAAFLSDRRGVARTIVLATDGAPNCNAGLNRYACTCTVLDATGTTTCDRPGNGVYNCLDDGRTIATIHTIADTQKIPVYVVGIGNTERPAFLRVLDEMAIAGGRPRPDAPRHYSAQSVGELTDALAGIRDSVTKCTYLTPSAPLAPDRMTVDVGGRTVSRDPTKTNGWEWIDQTYGTLAFFGEACALVQAPDGGPTASGTVQCD